MSRDLLPCLYVDFNEMLASDLVLLSQNDTKADKLGNPIELYEGLEIAIYSDDVNCDGKPDNLIAQGRVELNRTEGWSKIAKWCCRIDKDGISHESDRPKQ